jgi:ABC-type multidrug transport system fused ATPase/permease subunit
LAAILGVVGALYIVFLVKYFLETKVREAKDSLLLEMKENKHVVVEEISPAGVERLSVAHDALKSTSPPSNESKKSSFSMGKDSELAAKPSASEIDYLIEFEDISLVLPSGVQIMKGVCGKFQPRRLCAIMGPSGAG